MTVLDHILSSLTAAAQYNQHDTSAPRVILWTDPDRYWEPVVERIGKCRKHFYIWQPEGVDEPMKGSSTWIRYELSNIGNTTEVPVVYLPGISKADFRSSASFPEDAKHLFALQHVGNFWIQINHRDWTPSALLSSSDGGLALDLAQDQPTKVALRQQLESVLETQVSQLQGKRLEASDFNTLAVSDALGLMLRWMGDAEDAETSWPQAQWSAFTDICRSEFQFKPLEEGRIGAAEKLVAGDGKWGQIWSRYEEAPQSFPGVREALGLVQPADLFQSQNPRIPKVNEEGEESLRKSLIALDQMPGQKARAEMSAISKQHKARASSVWSELGEAPLAQAAVQLGLMVEAMKGSLPAQDWKGLGDAYLQHGWKVDAYARKAFAMVEEKQGIEAVSTALHALYFPWLENLAEQTGKLSGSYPNASVVTAPVLAVEGGTIHVFVDGLRADLAKDLIESLENSGQKCEVETAWSALPSVTATAKPAWAPLTERVTGESVGEGFEPQLAESKKILSTANFRKTIEELGLAYLPNTQTGDPSGSAWTEVADFDSRGHREGAKLAWRIEEELRVVQQRIRELFQAGWKKIVILTDHGWLWLPGGLPKVELPGHLTASKWGRCAILNPGTQTDLPQVPWFWGNEHAIVLAPQISAFKSGMEYAHGGLTLQEALTLRVTLENSQKSNIPDVVVASVRWVGLRLRVELTGGVDQVYVDIRTQPADAKSSVIDGARECLQEKHSILVEDDSSEGASAMLVLIYANEVIVKHPLVIGENQ